MHLNAHLDLDVVALEEQDTLTLMLDLQAPAAAVEKRAPGTVQIVLDRSGSMDGERLEAAKAAILGLVERLDPADHLGVVAFDDEAQVVVPAAPVRDKRAIARQISQLYAGASTNLSAGYLRGLQEVDRVAPGAAATVLLVTDGHANQGIVDPAALEGLAQGGRAKGLTTTALGIGLGYDEDVVEALARGGAGSAVFAEHADEAATKLAAEIDGLLTLAAQAASITVRFGEGVDSVRVANDLPGVAIEGGFMLELGDFLSEEQRRVLLQFDVPGMAGLGLAQIAEIELRWTALPDLTTHTVTLPVHVNVVPGDQAAGRIPDPVVRTELAFQLAQKAKREAAEALRDGDIAGAAARYQQAGDDLDQAVLGAPPAAAAEIRGEATLLRSLADLALHDDPSRTAKFSRADAHRKMRKRGREE